MQDIGFVFSPKSIAVVGASSNPDSIVTQNFLKAPLGFGYQGKIYPVSPYHSEIMGLKTYANIRDIPEPVDYVICGIPAALTPQLMQDCVAAKVKAVSLYTAGFSETGEEEGIKLERKLVEIARQGGVRIIGPNCLGIHFPKMGITFETQSSKESGHVSFLSQSGGNAKELIIIGAQRGIYFSKGL
jgi:acyl-CoA synthetase (NDP forming)